MRDDAIERVRKRMGQSVLCLMVLVVTLSSVSWISHKNAKLHRRGKKFVWERKWDKAIQVYGELLEKRPQSLYSDDAQFWIGFSLEQIFGKEKEAFDSFQRVIEEYPHSPWVDDAVIHQIFLAKRLFRQGEEDFGEFLRAKAANADSTVRNQAALALGELRDPTILSTLEEMVRGQDERLSKLAMDALRGYSETLEETVKKDVEPDRKREFQEKPLEETSSRRIYEKLQKTEGKWTEEKLFLNGLYHIVPKEDLAFYLSLENDWDQKEWWHKLWAPKDPTPTTPENEAEKEFKRRVLYTRKQFGKEWEPQQDYYPPWDSRGEVYIKFGKPDRREKADHDWEEWTYYRYRVNFSVSNRLSNRRGEGVQLGPVSHYIYRQSIGGKRASYILKPQFLYLHPGFEKADNIKDMELRIVSVGLADSSIRVRFTYRFPVQNLRLGLEKDGYKGAYRYRWVVYDEDYRSLASSDAVEEIHFTEKKDLKEKGASGDIEVILAPGSYLLALRIEDLRSNRMGVYRKSFTVQSKGGIDSQDVELMRK